MNTDSTVQISSRNAEERYFWQLIELGRTYYPPGHPVLSETFLKWFYLDNPAGPATLVVAHEADTWIGVIVLIPVLLEYDGRTQRAVYAVNVLTHPAHRGKNLFARMIAHAREILSRDNTWLLGHPNADALRGWRRQEMDFRDPLRLHLAKFRLPFSSVREMRVWDVQQLHAIPPSFWTALSHRPDGHLKYSPEYIAWRYLAAPHREYVVCAIQKQAQFVGLRVTRRFKGGLDLMVDFVGLQGRLADLLASVRRPTLVMHPGSGSTAAELRRACWRAPVKRDFPFFVTTWSEQQRADVTGITLAASDF